MSEADAPKFEEDVIGERLESEQLLLFLGDFDGPIDMLLSLARDQKVDLAKISILALANQYLEFIEKARALRLELAADYLVMAAWLAYLKSRILIPQEEKQVEDISAQDLADALQFQLRRLEAMRKVANDLFHLPRLGYNVFGRGAPEGLKTDYIPRYEMTFYDLLKSYGDIKQRQQNAVYKLNPIRLFSLEEAIERMENMLGKVPKEWVSLFMFMPQGTQEKIVRRSAVASTFGGALEMAKRGLIEIQQDKNYAPIYIRRPGEAGAAPKEAPPETPVDRDAVAAQEAELDALAAEEIVADEIREGAATAVEGESMAADIDMTAAVQELSEALAGHLTADLADTITDQEDLSDIERIQQEEA
ncbi:MAG TPA: ScpA family protein [Alphaproteobacteria bacterium]|nr:ScpA family protein [Alphaproteobacteria bacterium]